VSYPGAPDWMSGPIPPEPGQRFISYVAATADTNRDGAVDLSDEPRLYLSSLEGTGLRDVLPAGHRFEAMRPLHAGLLLILTRQGAGPGSAQRSFLLATETGELRPYAALDSVAARASAIAKP
jgi:hypothetical protein